MNSTLSFPLNESWDPSTISFQATAKESPVPKLMGPSLWADTATNTLITFGGDFDTQEEDLIFQSRTSVWVFTPDVGGSGSWGSVEAAGASGIVRRAFGASVVCAHTALQLGGYASSYTDPMYDNSTDQPVPGLLSHDLSSSSSSSESNQWSNASVDFVDNYMYGDAVCLPSYGREGLAVL